MKLFSTGNGALQRAAGLNGAKVIVFSIPALKTGEGAVICPMAGDCAKDGACYAMRGSYSWRGVKEAFEKRYAATLAHHFIDDAVTEIRSVLKHTKLRLFVRVHDSGDFYSPAYLDKWLDIANSLPHVTFYAYTKSLPWVRKAKADGKVPKNFVFTFSMGGKLDHTVDRATEKHTQMFPDLASLEAAGYANTTKDDLIAADPNVLKVGLIYHGGTKGAEAWKLPWKGMKAYKEAKS